MRARKSGIVVFRAIVDADGQAGKCDILQSSGTKELDDQTCELIRSRVRFKPAVAADGSKAVAPIVDAMNWQLGVAGRR